jgi:hypothetical protein
MRIALLALAWLLVALPAWAQSSLGSQSFTVSSESVTVASLANVDANAAVRIIVMQTGSSARTYDVTISGETPVLRVESAACNVGSSRCIQVWEDFSVAEAASLSITVTQSGTWSPYNVFAVEINCSGGCSSDAAVSFYNTPAGVTHYGAEASAFSSSANAYVTNACVSAANSSFGTVTAKSGWTLLDDTLATVMAQGIASAGALSNERGELTTTQPRESYCILASTKGGSAPDETAAAPGNSGTITTASVTETSLTLNWTEATDAVTAQEDLEYRVYQSSSNNIDSPTAAQTNGTLIQDWTADDASHNVTGLTLDTTYYFNVIVRDEADNRAAYTMKSQATAADSTAPTVSTLTPADNATDVNPAANLSLVFNETIVKGTGDLVIHRASDDAVIETIDVTSGLVSVSLATAQINPSVTLAASTEYYVLIDAGAFEDETGNAYAGISSETAWRFTTASATSGAPQNRTVAAPPAIGRMEWLKWFQTAILGGATTPPPVVPIVIETTTLSNCEVDAGYSVTLFATGGAGGARTWSVLSGVLPDGLTLNAATGAITGDCTTPGVSALTFRVADSLGTTDDSDSMTLTVVGPAGNPTPLSIIGTGTIHNAVRGQAYSKQFSCEGGVLPCGSWTIIDGTLLSGLSLNASTGLVTGTCDTDDEVVSFTIQATDTEDNVAGMDVVDHECVDPTAINAHTYFEALSAFPEAATSVSLRTQAVIDTYKRGSGSAAPYWTYVYPGALVPSDCYNGTCNDTYPTPLDAAKLTLPPEACVPKLDATRAISVSELGNGSVSRIVLSQDHGMNQGDTAVIVISGHVGSTPDINGTHTATAIDQTGYKAFEFPVNVTVAGSGGSVLFDQCDCTTEGQERCAGASDSLPGPWHLDVPLKGSGAALGEATAVGTIATSNADTDVWTTTAAHDLSTGDRVRIVNHVGATLAENVHNNYLLVTVTGATTFTLANPKNSLQVLDVEVGGTGGTITKATGTDRVLFTVDLWYSPESRENNLCYGQDDPVAWCTAADALPPQDGWMITTFKTLNIRQGAGGRWMTSPQIRYNRVTAADEIATVASNVNANPAPGVTKIDSLHPPGGNDGVTTGCATPVYGDVNSGGTRLPIYHSRWTRILWEVRMNVDASDPDWDCWKSVTGGDALWGKWHMVSMWVADETNDFKRALYKVPVYTQHANLDVFDFEFNTSAVSPAKTATWVYYVRNFVALRNYTLPAVPESDTAIFVRPVP